LQKVRECLSGRPPPPPSSSCFRRHHAKQNHIALLFIMEYALLQGQHAKMSRWDVYAVQWYMCHIRVLLMPCSVTFFGVILKNLDITSQKTYGTSITNANRNVVFSQFILRIMRHCVGTQTLSNSGNSYLPEGTAPVQFCAS
jgi:hypothetical protein